MAGTTPDVHDALSVLIGAVIGGFGLLAVGIGWVKSDIKKVDTRLSGVEERVTRIATLLEERLPEQR